MFDNFIQAAAILTIVLVVPSQLSVLVSVFANGELLDKFTVPDENVFNCSLYVQVGEFPSQINLCSLEGNQILSQKRLSGENSPSVSISRYYCINPIGRIQTAANSNNLSKLPDLSSTNCPPGSSTSCLVSHVRFQCNNDQEGNGVCLNDQITADSYGYQKNWRLTLVSPPESNSGNIKGSTASVTVEGGPCYYCENSKKLSTVIEFYCDERIMGKGKPKLIHNPTKSNPEVLLHWNTSAACYEFIPNQQCSFPDFSNICRLSPNSFGCDDSSHQYSYSLPPSANNSINSTDSGIKYTFGFCAGNVQCSSTDQNVMICRTEGQESKALASYSDNIHFVARPTGFVVQIKETQLSGSLKAVISFECSTSTADIKSMTVLGNDSLPILLTLKHHCFCPNNKACQAEGPTKSASTKGQNKNLDKVLISMGVLMVLFCLMVAFLLFVRHRQTRTRVPISNNNGVGNDDNVQPLVGNEGDSLLNISPSSTYQSCHSGDSFRSCLSRGSNDLQIDGEKQPQVEPSDSKTRESRM